MFKYSRNGNNGKPEPTWAPAFVRIVGAPGAWVVCVYYILMALVDKFILL